MQGETVTVEVDKAGAVTVKVNGVKGGGCKALTADIERALGKVTSDVPTAEMHQHAAQAAKARG